MPDNTSAQQPRQQVVEHLARVDRLLRGGHRAIHDQASRSPMTSHPEGEQALHELESTLQQMADDVRDRLASLGHPPPDDTAVEGLPRTDSPRASQSLAEDGNYLRRLSLAFQELQSASRAAGDRDAESIADRGHDAISYFMRERIGRLGPRLAAWDHSNPGPEPPGVAR